MIGMVAFLDDGMERSCQEAALKQILDKTHSPLTQYWLDCSNLDSARQQAISHLADWPEDGELMFIAFGRAAAIASSLNLLAPKVFGLVLVNALVHPSGVKFPEDLAVCVVAADWDPVFVEQSAASELSLEELPWKFVLVKSDDPTDSQMLELEVAEAVAPLVNARAIATQFATLRPGGLQDVRVTLGDSGLCVKISSITVDLEIEVRELDKEAESSVVFRKSNEFKQVELSKTYSSFGDGTKDIRTRLLVAMNALPPMPSDGSMEEFVGALVSEWESLS